MDTPKKQYKDKESLKPITEKHMQITAAQRKKKIEEFLWKKRSRYIASNKSVASPNKNAMEVDKEAIEEEVGIKGLNLNQHCKKKNKTKGKKCWLCKSYYHLKRQCPYIQCFYCHRWGHIKANCFKYQTRKIYAVIVQRANGLFQRFRKINKQMDINRKIQKYEIPRRKTRNYI